MIDTDLCRSIDKIKNRSNSLSVSKSHRRTGASTLRLIREIFIRRTMLRAALLLSVIALAKTADLNRIVGGQEAQIRDVPYQVSILLNDIHLCGGALISENWVLSSANCLARSFELLSVRFGSSLSNDAGIVRKFRSIILHPEYDANTRTNDIALALLEDPIEFSDSVQPIQMLEPNEVTGVNTTLQISGWGHVQYLGSSWAVNLRRGIVSSVDKDQCQSAYGTTANISDEMLCAINTTTGTDVCLGDFGGPLVSAWKLVGTASFGLACGSRGIPSVYSSLAAHRDWITAQTSIRY